MATHLSRHFQQVRLERRLRPGQLAKLCGCENIARNGGRIGEFEQSGRINPDLLARMAQALEIDQATIDRLIELDRQAHLKAWREWVSEPIEPHVMVRWIPAIYGQVALPADMQSREDAQAWTAAFALERHVRCCLVWSRRESVWFSEEGDMGPWREATPDACDMPMMSLNGKPILFTQDMTSVTVPTPPPPPA